MAVKNQQPAIRLFPKGTFTKQIEAVAHRLVDDRPDKSLNSEMGTFWQQCLHYVNAPLKLVTRRRKNTESQEAKVEQTENNDQDTARFVNKLVRIVQIMSGELKALREVLNTSDIESIQEHVLSGETEIIETDQIRVEDNSETELSRTDVKHDERSHAEKVRQAIEQGLEGSEVLCDMNIKNNLILPAGAKDDIFEAVSAITRYAARLTRRGKTIHVRAENIFTSADEELPIPEGSYGRITIKDNGIGMSETLLARLLRARPNEQTAKDSPIARASALVSSAGGYISARSELEVGTTFTLYVPISQAVISRQDVSAA